MGETAQRHSASDDRGEAGRWWRVLRLLVASVAAWGALTGTAQADSNEMMCRAVVVLLNPAHAHVGLVATSKLAADAGIVITYEMVTPGQRPRLRRASCTFAKRKGGDELTTVVSDGQALGVARMRFLKRYWLRSGEALEAAEALQPAARRQSP